MEWILIVSVISMVIAFSFVILEIKLHPSD